jgi:hypothetical protein
MESCDRKILLLCYYVQQFAHISGSLFRISTHDIAIGFGLFGTIESNVSLRTVSQFLQLLFVAAAKAVHSFEQRRYGFDSPLHAVTLPQLCQNYSALCVRIGKIDRLEAALNAWIDTNSD